MQISIISLTLIFSGLTLGYANASETIEFSSLDITQGVRAGVLTLPDTGSGPFPAVIMVHGTGGPGFQYSFHGKALRDAGFATFAVDFKSGIFSSAANRPPSRTFDPMAFSALRAVRTHAKIDPKKIAIMGYSLGGAIALRTSTLAVKNAWLDESEIGFAAHIAFYPGCQHQMRMREYYGYKFTGAPLLVLWGDQDSYGDATYCLPLLRKIEERNPGLAVYKSYPGTHHSFDSNTPYASIYDPAAINNTAIIKWNADAASDARDLSALFVTHHLLQRPVNATWLPVTLDASGKTPIDELNEWASANQALCKSGPGGFSDAVQKRVRDLKSDGKFPQDFVISPFKMKQLFKKSCS